ncbi:MAG: NAD-dependent epimerase/dehydratase family protein [Proteobacteria bacterium]|nr:NAD-dependent epimerase/dehydratase family protein [Pseudomonadota bacterium]
MTEVIAIAGASGFVGRRLAESLKTSHKVIGLGRGNGTDIQGIEWRTCDLFSLKQAEASLKSVTTAFYLVHSMMPQARLVQGVFEDFDVMIADNFVRACATAGVKRIIYLSGIIPEGKLSRHLSSRLEVERIVSAYGIDTCIVRAGLIVGPNGSSFNMMLNLVKRLPIMLCPVWTATLGQPSSLDDVIKALEKLVSEVQINGVWDIGGPDRLSYIDMMAIVAKHLKLVRRFYPVPFLTVGLSKLWVSLVSGYPKELVAPLIQSLKSPMLVTKKNLFTELKIEAQGFEECVKHGLENPHRKTPSKNATLLQVQHTSPINHQSVSKRTKQSKSEVCSMQRLVLPPGRDVKWVSIEYGAWVVRFLFPIVKVESYDSGDFDFSIKLLLFFGPKIHLLKLRYDVGRSSPTRHLYYIRGGLLVSNNAPESGRLEFRKIPDSDQIMAAIFNFQPSLPWWIYKFTQAKAHLWVMKNFGRYLKAHRQHNTKDPKQLSS